MTTARRSKVLLVSVATTALLSACASSAADVDETERNESGTVVEGGEVGVFRLQVGDCVQVPTAVDGTAPEVETLTAMPCSDEHTGEVILVENQFYADLDEFPGEAEVFELASPRCVRALDTYTGTDYETSRYDYFALVPTQATWDAIDDRELVCIGLTLADDFTTTIATTGSIRAD